MLVPLFNAFVGFITRPHISLQKYFVLSLQSSLPRQFDERTWYLLFGFMTLCTFILAYVLSRYIKLKDADDDPVYQRARLYSLHRKHRKSN